MHWFSLRVLKPETNMTNLPLFSSLPHYSWTIHNNSVLRRLWLVVSYWRTHIHLLQLDELYKPNLSHFSSRTNSLHPHQIHSLLLFLISPTSSQLNQDQPIANHKVVLYQVHQLVSQFDWFVGWRWVRVRVHHAYRWFYPLQEQKQAWNWNSRWRISTIWLNIYFCLELEKDLHS